MDNNVLYEAIFKRKSFHLFRNVGNEQISEEELDEIINAWQDFVPLYPDIKTAVRIVPENETSCKRGGEYCILMYSEVRDGYLQNMGYLGEQLDLYLVSKNIGTLWFGIGKVSEKSYQGMDFVIMISIRKISDSTKYRKDMFRSKRKSIDEIWQGKRIEGVTDIVRFAPSACNSQPWYVINDNKLSVYRYKKAGKRGIMPAASVAYFNRIDIGIFLCFMDICLQKRGIQYERKLYSDDGTEREMTLNAVYTVK